MQLWMHGSLGCIAVSSVVKILEMFDSSLNNKATVSSSFRCTRVVFMCVS